MADPDADHRLYDTRYRALDSRLALPRLFRLRLHDGARTRDRDFAAEYASIRTRDNHPDNHAKYIKQTHGQERQWYAIHTYSGYEDAVARNLKQRVESFGMKEKIFNVVVPTEKKIKIKNGRRTEVREKIFPGYVMVDMIATDDAWSVVRNTPQVT